MLRKALLEGSIAALSEWLGAPVLRVLVPWVNDNVSLLDLMLGGGVTAFVLGFIASLLTSLSGGDK